uniref:EPS8 signaling adaptor L1a n=1 Tax=Lates calcarifer TaxID=8187 RepID=A0A4W6ERD8_LATCA
MVNTTGGPDLGASVVSPAMTSGAVSLLKEHLTEEEKQLWTSLGPNWSSPWSVLCPVDLTNPPSPSFFSQFGPECVSGQPFEDPIELQHKQDALRESRAAQTLQDQSRQTAEGPEGNSLPPEGERLYCCSYDFVARNSSELSVLQGETLEVIESSKRWWKCQNRFDQIGFVPFNILEPLSALNNTGRSSPVVRRESRVQAQTRLQTCNYTLFVSVFVVFHAVLIMNDELLQRLAGKRDSVRPLVVPRAADTSAPLNYHSPPAEVEAWLTAKGFNQQTIQSLGILTGAQLFSLNKEELRAVSPEEGTRVYSQIMVQKSLLEDVRKATELEKAMEKQKLKMNE